MPAWHSSSHCQTAPPGCPRRGSRSASATRATGASARGSASTTRPRSKEARGTAPGARLPQAIDLRDLEVPRWRTRWLRFRHCPGIWDRKLGIMAAEPVPLATPDAGWWHVGESDRVLLRLEYAACRARAVIFDTAGLDPTGAAKVRDAALRAAAGGVMALRLLDAEEAP